MISIINFPYFCMILYITFNFESFGKKNLVCSFIYLQFRRLFSLFWDSLSTKIGQYSMYFWNFIWSVSRPREIQQLVIFPAMTLAVRRRYTYINMKEMTEKYQQIYFSFVTKTFVKMRTLVLLSCVLAYVTAECMPGGYCPMQNPESNLMLQEIVQFALTTHAAKTNSMCDNTFTIRHAETQVKTVT